LGGFFAYVYFRPAPVRPVLMSLEAVRVDRVCDGRRFLIESSGPEIAVKNANKKHKERGISTPRMKARLIMWVFDFAPSLAFICASCFAIVLVSVFSFSAICEGVKPSAKDTSNSSSCVLRDWVLEPITSSPMISISFSPYCFSFSSCTAKDNLSSSSLTCVDRANTVSI
jgi:hypothetical protein